MHPKLRFAKSTIKSRITGEKIPLVVGWEITQLCNLACSYCDVWAKKSEDLTTEQVREIIDGLAELGTYSISFDGGEPLMRKDMGEIIDHVRARGMLARIHSNGALFPRRIEEIKNLSSVKFSLDGPKDLNDAVRGEGVYDGVLRAVEVAHRHGIPAGLTAVISRANVGRVMEMAELAKEIEAPVTFQPCSNQVDVDTGINQHAGSPPVAEYRAAVRQLMGAKKTNRYIANSVTGLKHILQWPNPTWIPCYAGQLYVTISHKGKLYSCSRLDRKRLPAIEIPKVGIKKAMEMLKVARGCPHCWCARRAESNLLLHLNPAPLFGWYLYGPDDPPMPPTVERREYSVELPLIKE